jgi:hypothetical protein
VAHGVAHQAGGGQDVHAQGLVPGAVPGRVVVLDAAAHRHGGGVVHEYVDPAAPSERLAPEPVHLVGTAEVGAEEEVPAGREVGGGRPRRRQRSEP